jgi:hypothetical protein
MIYAADDGWGGGRQKKSATAAALFPSTTILRHLGRIFKTVQEVIGPV